MPTRETELITSQWPVVPSETPPGGTSGWVTLKAQEGGPWGGQDLHAPPCASPFTSLPYGGSELYAL